jgi:nitrous oxide reductase accessory protein NosL
MPVAYKDHRQGPRVRRLLLTLAAAVLLAGCGDSDQVDDAAPAAGADGVQREVRPLPPLDVETLTATIAGTTVSAEQHPGETYVGAVTDDLFIAVALPERSDDTEASATVYLCDSSEISEWLRGDIGTEPTTIDGETLTVELARAGGVVEGQVSLDDGSVYPFIAERATGDAGVYTLAIDDPTVLDDHGGDAPAVPADQPTDHRIAGAVTVDLRARDYVGGWIILN